MTDPFPPGGRLLVMVIAPDGTQAVTEIHQWHMNRQRHVEQDGAMPTFDQLINAPTQITITGTLGDIELDVPQTPVIDA